MSVDSITTVQFTALFGFWYIITDRGKISAQPYLYILHAAQNIDNISNNKRFMELKCLLVQILQLYWNKDSSKFSELTDQFYVHVWVLEQYLEDSPKSYQEKEIQWTKHVNIHCKHSKLQHTSIFCSENISSCWCAVKIAHMPLHSIATVEKSQILKSRSIIFRGPHFLCKHATIYFMWFSPYVTIVTQY